MSSPGANLFLLEDLEGSSKTGGLAERDLSALRTIASWIETFVAKPNECLGRPGPVCPFVPGARERGTLWLAPERIAGRSVTDLIQIVDRYKKLLLRTQPTEGDHTSYKAIVVVFTDASVDRAKEDLDSVQIQDFKRESYVEDGVVMGNFHSANEGAAIRNTQFHPFKSPVPFLLIRHGVISDWIFFLDNDDWLGFWRQRFGEPAAQAIAGELRHTNWRPLEFKGLS